ncbi:hypothetical protein JW824_03950 [bacterium]|nr:hypothetical protein [bacterium]
MNRFQRKWIALFPVCLLILFPSRSMLVQNTSDEEAKEVIATGMGSIIGGDIAHARDDAIDDALRTGIENALGTIIEAETLVENFQLIEDNIFSRTQGYVQNYQIVREGQRSEQLYEVTVNATIKMTDLKNDLEGIATLMRRKNTPRMMVIIQEQNIGEAPGIFGYFEADMNTAETAIMEAFMAKGFKFVDHETVRRNLEKEQAVAIMEGDVSKAAALGLAVGAEVVITGKALAKATVVEAFGATTRSQQATVTARAIRTDTGDIIAIQSADGAFPHIDDAVGGARAIQRACEALSEKLIDQILDQWQEDISQGSTITLQIEGVSDFSQLTKFKNALPYYVRGLTSVMQRDWHEGFATFEVVMTGSSEDLASSLSGRDIEGIQVKVIGMSQNSVTVEIVERD